MALSKEQKQRLFDILDKQSGFQQPQTPKPPQQQQSRGFEPSSLISELSGLGGGVGGAATGAAIGTGILPGVGTAVGGILGGLAGGFLGGTGGSAVEQQVRDKKVDVNKALKEGALEGVFSAGPLRIFRLGKSGFRIARTASKAGGVTGRETIDELSRALTSTTTKAGKRLSGTARGISAGQPLGGDPLSKGRADELNNFMRKTLGIKTGDPVSQLERLETKKTVFGEQLREVIEKSNRKLTKSEIEKTQLNFIDEFAQKEVGATDGQVKLFDKLLERIGNTKSLKELDELRKAFDDKIKFSRSIQSTDPQAESIFRLGRKVLTDEVASKVDGAKNIKSTLKNIYDSEELLLRRAGGRVAGAQAQPLGVPIPRAATSALGARTGSALETLGSALDAPLGATGRVTGALQGAGAAAGRQALQPENFTGGDELAVQDIPQEELGGVPTEGGGELEALLAALTDPAITGEQPQETGRLTQDQINQAILVDIAETGGENVGQIELIAEMFGPEQPPELSADQEKRLANASVMEETLNSLEEAIGELDLAETQAGATARGAFGATLGRLFDEDTKVFYNQIHLDAIRAIRSAGEVGNLSQTERQAALKSVPTLSDTTTGAQRKLDRLRQLLVGAQRRAVEATSGENGQPDENQQLAELLTQLGAQ